MTEIARYDLAGQHGAEAFRTLPEGVKLTAAQRCHR